MTLEHSKTQPVQMFPGITRRTLVHGPALMLVEFALEGGRELPMHTHPHEQAGYIVSGRLRLNIGGAFHELKAGDSYHVPSEVPHGATIHESAIVIDAFTPPRADYLNDAPAGDPHIRLCTDADFEEIYTIINDAAQAYRGIIPADRWHEPYMPREELRTQIGEGVIFHGYQLDGQLAGVMGLQHVQDVTLIRHAYVRTRQRNGGIGGKLLSHLRTLTQRPVLIGTWADAVWAIAFYEKHGFHRVTPEEKNRLLRRYWNVPERQIETSVVLSNQARSLLACFAT